MSLPHPPRQAVLLAAGLATRMRPVTDTQPKALIELGGRPIIDHCLDRLEAVGVEKVVINLHYLGDMIEEHLHGRAGAVIVFSRETELLETGGGIAKACAELDSNPFYVANAKILWLDGPSAALLRLAECWDDDRMDGLLLVHSTVEAYGYRGPGDFMVDPIGRLTRRPEREAVPYVYTGLQILHPRLFLDAPEGAFPLVVLYDRAIEADRLRAIVHDGEWFLVETPEGLAQAQAYMRERFPGSRHRGR